jgi:predicted CXXCH cytochrome family protein
MKQFGRLLLGSLLFVTSLWAVEVPAGPLSVLNPVPESVYTEPYASYVVRVQPQRCDKVVLVTDRNERYEIEVVSGRDTYCRSVMLHEGANKIHIRFYYRGEKVKEAVRTVYLKAPLSKRNKYVPREYRSVTFHTEQNDARCSRCHDMRSNEVRDRAFLEVTESNCYLCHRKIMDAEETHAPAVNWLCGSCHRLEGGGIVVIDPIENVCLGCHQKTRRDWEGKKYRHEPVAAGSCNRCHDPHASAYRFTLREPSWELCRTCHSAKADRATYIGALEARGVAIPGGKEHFSCASCHDPHVSDHPFFLKRETGKERGICQTLKR